MIQIITYHMEVRYWECWRLGAGASSTDLECAMGRPTDASQERHRVPDGWVGLRTNNGRWERRP